MKKHIHGSNVNYKLTLGYFLAKWFYVIIRIDCLWFNCKYIITNK